MQKSVLVIAGPTASGKSGLALDVARQQNGCIINADSMQVYEGLPLLTALPSKADLAKAPHRLYAFLHPNDACSAVKWRGLALEEIEKAHQENKLPILTGGTGFYLKTLLEGVSPMPEVPPDVREKMAAWQREIGNPAFHAELTKRDPDTAAKLDPFNSQRLVRAMEVLEHTGQSLAKWHEIPREKPPAHLRFIIVTLLPTRDDLYRNCDARFAQMIDRGAVEETVKFLERMARGEVSKTAPLAKALGFPELTGFIDGRITKEEAVDAAILSTRHYAKRQVTWFRNQVTSDVVLEKPDSNLIKFD